MCGRMGSLSMAFLNIDMLRASVFIICFSHWALLINCPVVVVEPSPACLFHFLAGLLFRPDFV